jgi:hypothetical protein
MVAMTAPSKTTQPLLRYLLLDDLYELLDERDDPAEPAAILATIETLLRIGPDPECDDMGAEESLLYLRLREFADEARKECCSRVSEECLRDAVLIWINRFQRKQRAAVLRELSR